MSKEIWNLYYRRPIEKIPWQNTQADWFKELVDNGTIAGETAIDMGCGTGLKSIYLAKHGFREVLGVDIAKKAIEIAIDNAKKANVSNTCQFIEHDVSDWSFLEENKQFDFFLDWANLHGLNPEDRRNYAESILRHSKHGSLLLIRAFNSNDDRKYFTEDINGKELKIYFFDKKNILQLFPEFEILDENTSQPHTKENMFFTELLLRRI